MENRAKFYADVDGKKVTCPLNLDKFKNQNSIYKHDHLPSNFLSVRTTNTSENHNNSNNNNENNTLPIYYRGQRAVEAYYNNIIEKLKKKKDEKARDRYLKKFTTKNPFFD